ncbi:hypothetical protein [Sinorhizobium fredii]|uniref:hypothetical protein n=1 Tax=Rhizobium fredii TaxID=380 RepID=UPI001F2984EF|nr:hypothetical protein [Sinorhizobium fredii]
MPIPIGTIRNASTPGDDIVQAVRRVLPPAGQRAEAIQKLLDMLGRHLSGKEVLPRDALVRLIEDLALLWQINSRLTMIGHPWHFNRGAMDGGAGCCTDGLAEAVR